MIAAAPADVGRMDAWKSATHEKLRNVRCPVHGQGPRVRFDGSSLRNVTVNVSGCCDHLAMLANRAIAER